MSDNPTPNPASGAEFRKLMSLFATGVCVVSLTRADGKISAMTVNSLVSVSLDPMLVCWSLQNSASQFADYAEADHFAISILADGQQALARRYAARGDTALNPEDFETSDTGLPLIKSALAAIECSHWNSYPAGDHTMILGEVTALHHAENPALLRGLGFYGGRFCAVGE